MKTIQVLCTVTNEIDFEAATYVVALYSQLDTETKESIFSSLPSKKSIETLAYKISLQSPSEVSACLAYKGNSLVGWALKKKGETSLLASCIQGRKEGIEVSAALRKFKES